MGGPEELIRDVSAGQWGGLTSIATYALLAAGDTDHDERIAKAIGFMRTGDVTGTYALGLHAQVWNYLNPTAQNGYKAAMVKDAQTLLRGLRQTGDAKGLYHYTPDDFGWDNSTAQFGVLGMWGCALAGYEVPTSYWKAVEDAWVAHQDKSGGWSYGGGMGGPGGIGGPGGRAVPGGPMRPGGGMGPPDMGRVKLSMTAAGVATLFITADYLHNVGSCNGNYVNAPIDAGLKWIDAHFGELASEPNR